MTLRDVPAQAASNLKLWWGGSGLGHQQEFLQRMGDGTLEWAAQRGGGVTIPEGV